MHKQYPVKYTASSVLTLHAHSDIHAAAIIFFLARSNFADDRLTILNLHPRDCYFMEFLWEPRYSGCLMAVSGRILDETSRMIPERRHSRFSKMSFYQVFPIWISNSNFNNLNYPNTFRLACFLSWNLWRIVDLNGQINVWEYLHCTWNWYENSSRFV